ncbi:MAG TPA: nitronate monooxygenase, partial [Solirubrobacterales bacterium]|nr:nitronate monooxygenase [Solirubrobacterales bacterium]
PPGVADPPRANRILNRLLVPGSRYLPAGLQARMIRSQRPDSRLLTPAGPTDDGPATLVDAGALYAGETVARIEELRPAAELVRDLAG